MTEGVWIQIITTVGLVVVAMLGNRKLNIIRRDSRTAAEQTANSHAETEYPNLRDDLDAKFEGVAKNFAGTNGAIRAVHERLDRHEAWMRDNGRRIDAVDEDTQRRDKDAEREFARRVDALVSQTIPSLIRTELGNHVGSCPLREPRT